MKYRKCPLLVVICGFLFFGVAHGSDDLLKVTHKVTLEVKLRHQYTGRIEIGLFGKTVPKTVENFIQLAVRPKGLGYVGTKFTRIVKDGTIQAGRIGNRGTAISYYGGLFPDENFKIKHYGSGWVAMASAGRDTNACQFYITSNINARYKDGEHVVFGKVLKGMDVVHKINGLKIDSHLKALEDAEIFGCIVEPLLEPFTETPEDAKEIHLKSYRLTD